MQCFHLPILFARDELNKKGHLSCEELASASCVRAISLATVMISYQSKKSRFIAASDTAFADCRRWKIIAQAARKIPEMGVPEITRTKHAQVI